MIAYKCNSNDTSSRDVSVLGTSLRILNWSVYHRTPLNQVYIPGKDYLQEVPGLVTGCPANVWCHAIHHSIISFIIGSIYSIIGSIYWCISLPQCLSIICLISSSWITYYDVDLCMLYTHFPGSYSFQNIFMNTALHLHIIIYLSLTNLYFVLLSESV